MLAFFSLGEKYVGGGRAEMRGAGPLCLVEKSASR